MRSIAINLRSVLYFLQEIIVFIIQVIMHPSKSDKINIEYKESVIIGNGPSAIETVSKRVVKDKNIICFNDFSTTEIFHVIKPTQYFLIDPFFFTKSERSDQIFREINAINWQMLLCIPSHRKKYVESLIFNENIKLIKLSINSINLSNKFIFYLYSKGVAMPKTQNVSVAALMYNIFIGVEFIELHGMEHNWPNLMFVNEKNELCLKRTHFFDDKNGELSIWRRPDGSNWNVADSLKALSRMFQSYNIIADYSSYRGVTIKNRTESSLIDAFERS